MIIKSTLFDKLLGIGEGRQLDGGSDHDARNGGCHASPERENTARANDIQQAPGHGRMRVLKADRDVLSRLRLKGRKCLLQVCIQIPENSSVT